MVRKWCSNCKRYVEGKKNFHAVAFILIMVFFWLPLLSIEVIMGLFGYGSYRAGFLETTSLAVLSFLMFLCTLIAPMIYPIYHWFGKKPRCPICNSQRLFKNEPPPIPPE